jgi:uncharacterized protein
MIWILWHNRLGDLNQMVQLAEALELPYEIKKLEFRAPHYGPLSRYLLRNGKVLTAPFPKLVISAEAMCSNVAHQIKKASGGAVKTIALARPCGDPEKFDLVLTTAQFGLLGGNVVTLNLPLTSLLPPSHHGKDTVVVAVGGNAPPDVLNAEGAHKMAAELLAFHRDLCVVTSPRTPQVVAEILSRHIVNTHIWQKDHANPYVEKLASAAEIIVTSDSVSMLADALVQHVPVQVYKLPQRMSILQKLVMKFYRRWPKNFIFRHGLIEPTPNRIYLVERLVKQGFVSWFGEKESSTRYFDAKMDQETAKEATKLLL